MRHKVFGKKLKRDYDHRRALFKNLTKSFFANSGKMVTTLAKAQAVRPMLEKAIGKIKKGDLISRRWLFKIFKEQKKVNEIVKNFSETFSKRSGNFTKIVRLKKRQGDDAVLVKLEVRDAVKVQEEKEKKEKEEVKKTKGK